MVAVFPNLIFILFYKFLKYRNDIFTNGSYSADANTADNLSFFNYGHPLAVILGSFVWIAIREPPSP